MAKTKKFKFIGIILAAVICLTYLSGCALFTQTTADKRSDIIATVNGEEITLGEYYDTLNTMYSQYYYYVYMGQLTIEDIAQMTYNALVNSRLILAEYKALADEQGTTYDHKYINYKDAEYLSLDEMIYIIKSVKKSLFESYDSAVETLIKADGYTLESATTVTDTDRIPPIYQTITSITDIKIEITDEDEVNDYLLTTPGGLQEKYFGNEQGYIFTDLNSAELAARVEQLNSRITLEEGQTAITAEQYVQYQKEAVASTEENVYSNYGLKLAEYVPYLIESAVYGRLMNTIAARIFKITAESDITELLADLNAYYIANKSATEENYILNPDAYATFVEKLADTSVIYSIPETYQGKYIFVKNCLIPFSDEQLAFLKTKAEEYGDDDTIDYLNFREEYATQIVLENYLTGEETSNVFTYNESTNRIEIVPGSILANEMNAITSAQDFENLMYRYNSDTAQFDSYYDYVVRVDAPEGYTAKWVSEFVTGAEEAYAQGEGGMSAVVSEYGIHIIYYTAPVTEQTVNFTEENIFDTSTFEYMFYNAYYDSVANDYVNDRIHSLRTTAQVETTKAFSDFLDLNGWTITTKVN